jgi:hypothetical protein
MIRKEVRFVKRELSAFDSPSRHLRLRGGFHGHPVHSNVFSVSQPIAEYSDMVLEMSDVVELELHLAKRQPVESGWGVQFERGHLFLDLLPADFKILEDFFFAVRFANCRLFMRRPGERSQILVFVSVLAPRSEFLFGILQVKVRVEESMIRDMPELVLGLSVVPERHRPFCGGVEGPMTKDMVACSIAVARSS